MVDMGTASEREARIDERGTATSTAATPRELTQQVKRALRDPRKLAAALGLVNERSEKQARGIIVNCPAHADRGRPNLSLTTGKDGTVRAKCHACDFTGDALTLVAEVYGLDMRKNFRQVLVLGAELGGENELAAEIGDGVPRPERKPIPAPRQLPDPPWAEDVSILWDSCLPVSCDRDALEMLGRRGIDPHRVEALNLARVLPGGHLPPWAAFGRRSWRETGHRLVVRAFDAEGTLRALRGWRVVDNDTPKRLPPAGCKSAGLVLANRSGWQLLRGEATRVLYVVEGEPDWLAATLAAPPWCSVWGVGSGSWGDAFAKKALASRRVIASTHPDAAGDRYAGQVTSSVPRSARWRPPRDLDEVGDELQALLLSCAKWLFVPHVLGD